MWLVSGGGVVHEALIGVALYGWLILVVSCVGFRQYVFLLRDKVG